MKSRSRSIGTHTANHKVVCKHWTGSANGKYRRGQGTMHACKIFTKGMEESKAKERTFVGREQRCEPAQESRKNESYTEEDRILQQRVLQAFMKNLRIRRLHGSGRSVSFRPCKTFAWIACRRHHRSLRTMPAKITLDPSRPMKVRVDREDEEG